LTARSKSEIFGDFAGTGNQEDGGQGYFQEGIKKDCFFANQR
jgi:hypothetical protein